MRDHHFYVTGAAPHMAKADATPRPSTTLTRTVPKMQPYRNGSTCGPSYPQHGRE